ncbi:MAG: hypothetical protein IJA19_00295 [Clostridia bacterium]|nr:hypothetical protein [Clostridia bacterium]
MTNKKAKQKAHKILLQNRLYSLCNCNDLERIIKSYQFTVIEYKKSSNSENLSALIKKLRVENEIKSYNSFLYIKNNLKFLFINKDVAYNDRCSLLRHELGHICDPDFTSSEISHSEIEKEEFANDFSYYIKNPGVMFKFRIFIIKKWKLLVGVSSLICFIAVLCLLINSPSIQTSNSDKTCYVTSGGKKYHEQACIIIKYRNNLTEYSIAEAVKAGYEPCLVCLPEE